MSNIEYDMGLASKMLRIAEEALEKSYAPYSKIRVGASVLTKEGNIYTGCNIENSSYSLTLCAERVAVAHAISMEGNKFSISAIGIAVLPWINCPPCGACCQFISEFGTDILIISQDSDGNLIQRMLNEYLPYHFSL